MKRLARLRESLFGKHFDPAFGEKRQHALLVAFLAWIGLGAGGRPSACNGPEEARVSLDAHAPLGLYLAAMAAVTGFVIAVAYNHVIDLSPSAGGGYTIVTNMLGRHAWPVSGGALIVNYVLTIAIPITSGVDALFSLMPATIGSLTLCLEILPSLLLVLNIREMKEAVRFMLPNFVG